MVGTTYFFFFCVLKNINKIKKQEGFVVGEESCFDKSEITTHTKKK